jgi:hypothetical protein
MAERKFVRKNVTQENCGPLKEFAAAGIRTTLCAKVERGREHGLQKQGENNIAPRTLKGRTMENNRLKNPKCKSGISDIGVKRQLRGKMGIKEPRTRWQLRLKSERTISEFARYDFGLEFIKQANDMSSRLQRIRIWTLWRGRPPPKRKKKLQAE